MAKTLTAKTVSARERRARVFLRALAAGGSATTAARASGLAWNTLYKWRRRDAAFRAAWDEAVAIRDDARIEHLDGEMMRRAVEAIEDPVVHNGEQVATRKRYSDPLLMFAIRELRGRRRSEREAAERPPERPRELPNPEPRITVVVRQFGPPPQVSGSEARPALPLPAPAKEGGDE